MSSTAAWIKSALPDADNAPANLAGGVYTRENQCRNAGQQAFAPPLRDGFLPPHPFFLSSGSQAVPRALNVPDLDRQIRVAGRVAESIVDGPGLRYVLFTQGCPHACPGCHNPETHDFQGGNTASLKDVYHEIRRNPLLRGLTFSGGEPLCRWRDLLPLATVLKAQSYHLMAYTGYTLEALLDKGDSLPFLSLLDILVDGPFVLAEKSLNLRFRGSRNQRVLDMPASLKAGCAVPHAVYGQ